MKNKFLYLFRIVGKIIRKQGVGSWSCCHIFLSLLLGHEHMVVLVMNL